MILPVIKLNKIFNYKNTFPFFLKAFVFTIVISSFTFLTSCSDENIINPNETIQNKISKDYNPEKYNSEVSPYLNKIYSKGINNNIIIQILNQKSGLWIDLKKDEINSLKPKKKLNENEEFVFKNQTQIRLRDILLTLNFEKIFNNELENNNNEISLRIIEIDEDGNSNIVEEINKIQITDIKNLKECKTKIRENEFK